MTGNEPSRPAILDLMQDDLLGDRIEVRLGTERVDGRPVFRSELYVDGRFDHASEWTRHPVTAHRAGDELRLAARSDLAYRDARYEVAQLYARAS